LAVAIEAAISVEQHAARAKLPRVRLLERAIGPLQINRRDQFSFAAKVRFPPSTSAVPQLRRIFTQAQRTAECPHCRQSVKTKTSGHNKVVKNGGFWQGQKRLSFVPNCKHNEPTGDIQACHSKPSLFAGATSCSAQTGHSPVSLLPQRGFRIAAIGALRGISSNIGPQVTGQSI
jgi:Zn finger protein HypA/HybF involved in hydrogenase expression